jgi:hypothetical protein
MAKKSTPGKLMLAVRPATEQTIDIKKLNVTSETYEDFLLYKRAFFEAYGTVIEDAPLVAQLLTLGLAKDKSFQNWKETQPAASGQTAAVE